MQQEKTIEQIKMERLQRILKAFKEMGKFNNIEELPSLPIINEKDYKEVIIPNLIRCGAIPKSELKINTNYLGSCRNASEAVWDGEKFIYQRYKFGVTFPEEINHFEDDNGYDLFIPLYEKKDEL